MKPDEYSSNLPPAGVGPDGNEIRWQLARILASDMLRGSLRLTRFLQFVVETTLAGKASTIKAYTVAVEALGRNSDFDPQDRARRSVAPACGARALLWGTGPRRCHHHQNSLRQLRSKFSQTHRREWDLRR
jgi:hypothetical protein